MTPEPEENPRLHLVHCTSVERGRSIVDEGLKPGTEDRTNYDANRWMPLDGVYLSVCDDQILQYRRAHALQDYALVLVEADARRLLPDEDIVDVLLHRAYLHCTGPLDRDRDIPPPGDAFWDGVRDRFVESAGPRSDAPLRDGDLDEVVDWWADYEYFGEGGDIDPFEWAALKDRIVRAFPHLEGSCPTERSKRFPGTIGFEGDVRIVAVVECSGGTAGIIRGCVPDEAVRMVERMIDGHLGVDAPALAA